MKAWNEGGAAGLVARLNHGKKGSAVLAETGTAWKLSPAMPPALINNLNQDELLDLLAFLISGGNPQDKAFQ